MKVAIVAVGELARYFIDELPLQNHTVVCISRTRKAFLTSADIEQRISDYSAESLTAALADCDAVICTLRSGVPSFVGIHAGILAACQASPTCKRFIPSVWAGNVNEFPDEPLDWAEDLEQVLSSLRKQSEVYWSAICPGWFAEYVIPDPQQRYLADIGDMWPQNHKDAVFTLYGAGSQLVDFTSARDTARAVGMLLAHDRRDWEEYTYLSGDQLSWKMLAEFSQRRDPNVIVRRKSLAASVRQYIAKENEAATLAAVFEIWAHSDALHFPPQKVFAHRKRYFPSLEFRTLKQVAEAADVSPGKVV